MSLIIKFLDNYLFQTGRSSLDPVEANALLAKAGILRDSKDRPGKPLRNKLRKGELPHAFQSGGKGSNWTIPHSAKRELAVPNHLKKKPFEKDIGTRTIANTNRIQSKEILQIEKELMHESSFKSAGIIDSLTPHSAGLYCIRISDINQLPNPFSSILAQRQHNIIYVGIASENLNKRFLNQELRAKGHGTFFRSIGALLGYRPPIGSLITKANKRNYKFAHDDEQKLINWINRNLIVNWVECSGELESIETELIQKYRPLVNLAKNPSALSLLSDLRKECVQIANAF